jgi:hypothetical protein
MEVRTERTTTRGDERVDAYHGERFIQPPHSRPSVDGDTVLGTVTDITDIGGGEVTFKDADGDIRCFGEVEAVRCPPVGEKARLEFTSIPAQTVALGRLIGIEQGDGPPNDNPT